MRAPLGAPRRDLMRLVLTAGLRVVVVGLVVGLVAAIWLASMLVGVTPGDPLTYLAAITVLVVASIAAIIMPARRAMRLDPIIALQAE